VPERKNSDISVVTVVYSPENSPESHNLTSSQPNSSTMAAASRSSYLDPFAAMGSRRKQIQDAKDMQQVVLERARRAGMEPPPYEFLELIGKGSFGRVYRW